MNAKNCCVIGRLAAVAIAVAGLPPARRLPRRHARQHPSYYSLKLPAGVTIADLVRDGYDISHGHGSRPIVVATPAEVERLRDRGVVVGKTGNVYQPVIRSPPTQPVLRTTAATTPSPGMSSTTRP